MISHSFILCTCLFLCSGGNYHVQFFHLIQLYVQLEMLSSITSRGQQRERDVLLRALVEAEIDGAALANQVTALKETVDSIAKVNLYIILIAQLVRAKIIQT